MKTRTLFFLLRTIDCTVEWHPVEDGPEFFSEGPFWLISSSGAPWKGSGCTGESMGARQREQGSPTGTWRYCGVNRMMKGCELTRSRSGIEFMMFLVIFKTNQLWVNQGC